MANRVYFKLYRGLIAVFLVFFLAMIIIVMSGYYLVTHRPLPQVQGSVSAHGLQAPALVVRDRWGTPHIRAGNFHDLFFAVGYAQAQDRLFQMDLARRAAKGGMAEWFGEQALPADKLARALGLGAQARKNLRYASPDAALALAAFAEGVNAFVESRGDNLPAEYRLLGVKFEDWEADDSLAVLGLTAWQMAPDRHLELIRFVLARERGAEFALRLLPDVEPGGSYSEDSSGSGPADFGREGSWLEPGDDPVSGVAAFLAADRLLAGAAGSWSGADAVALSGRRTRSGYPILAGGPLLGFSLPPAFYEMHLAGAGFEVMGLTLPGVPAVMVGHTRRTAFFPGGPFSDATDFFIEETNEGCYFFRDECVPFEEREEVITVRRGNGSLYKETFTARLTPRGPVVVEFDGRALSLAWTGHEVTDPVGGLLEMAWARDFADFEKAARRVGGPARTWLYADRDGAAMVVSGLVPVRPRHRGALPAPGESGTYDWQGYVSFAELPRITDPPGIIVAADNQPAEPDSLAYRFSNSPSAGYRARRLNRLIGEGGNDFTAQGLMEAMADDLSLQAERLLPVFMKALEARREDEDILDRAARQLSGWDGRMEADASAPLIFEETYWRAARIACEDEMDEATWNLIVSFLPSLPAFDRFLEEGSEFFDDRRTEREESREEVILAAFREALAFLEAREGPRMSKWSWGRFYRLELANSLAVWDRGRERADHFKSDPDSLPLSGSNQTLGGGYYFPAERYKISGGAGFRYTVDLADPVEAYLSLAGGQSGQAFSPHRADQLADWASGKGHPMIMDMKKVDRNREAVLEMLPASHEKSSAAR